MMNPPDMLDFILDVELLQTFHCKKTEISCIGNPQTFLNQLRDHNFVPEDKYAKVSRMKSKEMIKKGIYEILDWVEKYRSKDIRLFWKCVFKDVIVFQYPTIKELHRSFLDGSFRSFSKLAETAGKEAGDTSEGSQLSENEKKQTNPVKKRRKRKSMGDDSEEEPGPSSQVTPSKRKKPNKIVYSSPLRKGEKGEIWNWAIYRVQLPVTCGDQEGFLQREKMAKGEKCILADKKWFTPNEFEKFAGKKHCKNWKYTIRCAGKPLGELIKGGHLKWIRFKKRHKVTKKSIRCPPQLITDSEEEEEENEESSSEDEEPQSSSDEEENAVPRDDGSQKVFSVTCGSLTGKLHKKRFGTGICGKSIRTETSWMTPKDFAKEGSGLTNVLWRRDIQWEGKPLSDLIKNETLRLHSVKCECENCKPDENDLANQKNDDECWVCKIEDDGVLVECDSCPRSFHQKCHLPHVEDSQLSDDQEWKCTFCMFKSSQDCRDAAAVEKNRVMSYQMHRYTQECHYLILSLFSADEQHLFATDPSLQLDNYSSFIRNPMWLCKVVDKLQKKEYQTVGQFVSDVQLIFTNCATYHTSDEDIRAMGENLKQIFESQFTTVFNVHE